MEFMANTHTGRGYLSGHLPSGLDARAWISLYEQLAWDGALDDTGLWRGWTLRLPPMSDC